MILRGILGFLLSISFIFANSQIIKGRLNDENDNTPLSGATLKLLNLPDSSSAYSTVSDKSGAFMFQNVKAGQYVLSVTYIGYGNSFFSLTAKDSTIDMGMVAVSKTAKTLTAVNITVSAPPVKQKVDTLEYSANQYKVNPDANAEDLIKKMPGVTVDKSGAVTAHGETVRKVTVDGKDFFGDDATATLRNLPSEIIDKIQVFDRLSDQAQFTGFDDGNSQKAINVVTKANMRNGQFGRLYAGLGTDERYTAGGNVSFFKDNRRVSLVGLFNNINMQNFSSQDLLGVTSSGGNRGGGGGGGNRGGGSPGGGGRGGQGGPGMGGFGGGQGNFLVGQANGVSKTSAFGINYSDMWGKKLTVSGSYFFNNSNNANNQLTNRETFLSGDSSIFYKENSLSSSTNYNNRINLRIEYKMDSSNSLMITPNLSFQKNNSQSDFSGIQGYSSDFAITNLLNTSNSLTKKMTEGYNLGNNILYRHSFLKKGRTFSIGLNTSMNHKDGDTYVNADSKYYKNGVSTDSVVKQFANNLTNGYTIASNFAYTEPIGKQGQLQFNYNPSYTKNKADQQTYQYDVAGSKYSIFDTKLSNKFENTFITQNGGLTYRVGDRDNQFSVGMSVQNSKLSSDQSFPVVASIDKSYTDLLPNLQLRRKISPKSSINVFFRTSVNAPSVSQLQDVVNNSNQLQYSTGNIDLRQQYSSSLVTRYTFTNSLKGQSFFANLFIQKIDNYIASSSYFTRKDSALSSGFVVPAGVNLIKPINLDGYWGVRSFLTYGAPVKAIKSNINLNAGVSYSKLPGSTNYNQTIIDNYAYSLGAVVASNINQYVDFNVSYNSNFNVISQQPENNYYTQTFGLQFNLLTKKGQFLQNELNNQFYNYKSTSVPDQNFWLWNVSIGQKFLKNQAGELKLSVFDLLKQNKSITRTVTETYVEDVQSVALRQYFMLTFTYKLKNFGTAAARAVNNNRPRDDFRGGF